MTVAFAHRLTGVRESAHERHDGPAHPPAGGRALPAGHGPVRREPRAPRCAPRDVRPLAVRARAHRRDRRLGGIGAARDPGLHRRRLRPRHVPAAADPGPRPADGAAVPRATAPSASSATSSRSSSARRASTGVDAAELVAVDYDPLPVVVDPGAALEGDVLLYPEAGTNVCTSHPVERDEALFDGCDVVVSGSLVSQRLAACPLESRACAAVVRGRRAADALALDADAAPGPQGTSRLILGMEPGEVRVVAPDVGGGFGAKLLGVEEVIVSWLARKTGTPVRWTETRSENMVAMAHGRAAHLEFTIGGSREGDVQAYRLRVVQDAGAYPRHRRHPPRLHGADGERRVRDPEDRGGHGERRHQHDARSARSAAPGGRRRRRRSSARWTCSPPRSGSTPPRFDGATSSSADAFPTTTASGARLRLGRLRAGARPRARHGRLPGRCARSSGGAASRATRARSASA